MSKGLVLVTGGAGFIGSHTVDVLLEGGYRVRVLDNLQPRVHPLGKPTYLNAEAEFQHGDVNDREALTRAMIGADYIMHLAAHQDYLPDFSKFIHVNMESASLIFEVAVERGLSFRRVLYASSQAVAGEGVYTCEEHGTIVPRQRSISQLEQADWEIHCPYCGDTMYPQPISEEIASPHTTYGISKLGIELLAATLGQRYGIPTTCMRYTYVQGTRNSYHNTYSGALRIFCLRLLKELPPLCYEDGNQLRDFINVADVARANLVGMECSDEEPLVFNVGGGKGFTIKELAEAIIRILGSDVKPVIPGEFRLGDTRHTVSDISKLCARGWTPVFRMETSIRQYLNWLRAELHEDFPETFADETLRNLGVIRRVR